MKAEPEFGGDGIGHRAVSFSSRSGVAQDSTRIVILVWLSISHGLHDLIASLVTAVYPLLKTSFALDFGQIGLITLAAQLTASLLQPLVGLYTDRKPSPYFLPVGMGFTLCGLLLLSAAPSFMALVAAASLIGMGSSVFHPEASRVARVASGGRHGFAQSLFQVGGAGGAAIGPLTAALIVAPFGRGSLAWFAIAPLCSLVILTLIGQWHKGRIAAQAIPNQKTKPNQTARRSVAGPMLILLALIFSKYFYLAVLSNYYTFYLIDKFQIPVQTAQILLFVFLGASACGTFLGGPIGDRFGRRAVILFSIVGALPFTLAMPYANLFFTVVLSIAIGLILSSAFAAILVYATELTPDRVGTVAGLFFGLAFGTSALGAAALGHLVDVTSIGFVYRLCSMLPALGLLAYFLPRRAGP
ncbi:MFS transporter [Methylocapsa acidiphila]|uniref:MFS transporter n=1 Tax=Methylocapsa acidiphila TaxID=133552 RepID=UPI0003F50757|nr:MFS transporter [Methylocapsa acidiphila]